MFPTPKIFFASNGQQSYPPSSTAIHKEDQAMSRFNAYLGALFMFAAVLGWGLLAALLGS